MLRDPLAYAQIMMDAAGVPAAVQADPKTSAFYVGVATALVSALKDAEVAFRQDPTDTTPRIPAVVSAGMLMMVLPPPVGTVPAAGPAVLR